MRLSSFCAGLLIRAAQLVVLCPSGATAGKLPPWRLYGSLYRLKPAHEQCIAPGICKQPSAKHSRVLDIKPRRQWNVEGGFCGEMSIQASALAFGAWISQDLVRKASPHGEGNGSPGKGYEVLPSNVAETAQNLRLAYNQWDYTQKKPQAPAYKRWLKLHLSQGHPVIWFPMCKGDDPHVPYPHSAPNGGRFDHVEPVWGIGSNHPLDDPNVYDDDWLVHGSGQDLQAYYRTFSSLEDTSEMKGNCKMAQAGQGLNEMYPCIYDQVDYGLAITGLAVKGSLPVSLSVDRQSEPNVRSWARESQLHGRIKVSGLQRGARYVLYRYASAGAVPVGRPFNRTSQYELHFVAKNDTWSYEDPHPFPSSGATYYVAVPEEEERVAAAKSTASKALRPVASGL